MDAEFNLPPPLLVKDINFSSGDKNNFRIHVRVSEGLSPVNARNGDDETLPFPPPPFTYDRLLEREGESSSAVCRRSGV
jgi:hypothetical protein